MAVRIPLMRRLFRLLFTILAALSLLLCVATCVLWVRGNGHCEVICREVRTKSPWQGNDTSGTYCETSGFYCGLMSSAGAMNITWSRSLPDSAFDWDTGRQIEVILKDAANWKWTFEDYPYDGYAHYPVGVQGDERGFVATYRRFQLVYLTKKHNPRCDFEVTAPHWAWIALMLVSPATWAASRWSRIRKRRAAPAKQCATCGYDLRATPDRCPECGKLVAITS